MIEYLYTEGRNDVPVAVRMDGKVVGEIRPVDGGWQFFPKGMKNGGDVFKTLGSCQRSLVEE